MKKVKVDFHSATVSPFRCYTLKLCCCCCTLNSIYIFCLFRVSTWKSAAQSIFAFVYSCNKQFAAVVCSLSNFPFRLCSGLTFKCLEICLQAVFLSCNKVRLDLKSAFQAQKWFLPKQFPSEQKPIVKILISHSELEHKNSSWV